MIVLQISVAILVLIGVGAIVAVYRHSHQHVATASPAVLSTTILSYSVQEALAKTACGREISVDAKHAISCSVCPPNSDFAGEGGMPGSPSGWTYDSALIGHFTAADANEVLLHASGCESHARNYGGDFLIRQVGNGWSLIRYAPGATADESCQKLSWQQGRDAVICQTGDMHQGQESDAVQFLLFDATAPANEDWKNTLFLETTNDSSNCGFTSARTIQMGKIDAVELLPRNTSGKQDVAVQATITRVPAPPEGTQDCPVGNPHTYRVLFHNMGDHFEAADGYTELAALTKDDCCELAVNEKVRPGKY